MPLTPGAQIGVYQIVGLIGAGGMGEVYRARDTRLNRDVAIKILPALFAADADRVARFQREAQMLASLNHPHIAHIYGLEEAQGTRALVLELVDGPTLADRISEGPMPLVDALPIARQIAEALEAAHEHGIIHRDLKPANIKLTGDGNVKVLDFGLAKALDPGTTRSDVGSVSNSPTITSPALATHAGVILGTAAYMSPEQAKGKPVDKRSDIWAFGCVLFEMLTGTRAFQGDDVPDTMASILKSEPDWKVLPTDVPSTVRTLVQRCLAKDRAQRVSDISIARFLLAELTNPGSAGALSAGSRAPTLRPPLWTRVATHTTAGLVGAALVGGTVWLAVHAMLSTPRVSRLQITPVGAAALSIDGFTRDLAITPDGSRIVYAGANGTTLFVRALDQIDATPLTGLGAASGPFVSPNGQWIGFVDGRTALKKVAITGGPAVPIGLLDGALLSASWSPDDTIVYATLNPTTGLQVIPAGGGEATVLTRPNRARGEADHLWPEVLPGGHAVLFTITSVSGGLDQAQIAVQDLRTRTETVLIRGGSDAHYAASGHLIYAAAGSLRAVGFDLTHLAIIGTPVPVVPQVAITGQGGADVAIGTDGTLAYAAGVAALRSLVWVDRQGHETPLSLPPRAYNYPRLAPDGSRFAVGIADQDFDIWLGDTTRTALTRITFDPGIDNYPVWAPDGRRIFFSSMRAGTLNLFVQAADGTGDVSRLTESPNAQYSTSVSPDGTRLIFTQTTSKTNEDVMQLRLDRAPPIAPEPLVQTPFLELNGELSPNGRWLAYQANDSGAFEIYVRPFPEVNSGHWQVSTGGGTRPLWSHTGQELVYAAPTGELMRVGVENGPSWSATPPTKVLDGRYYMPVGAYRGRTYDVSRDGQRFLMIRQSAGPESGGAPAGIVVVQNWFDELKRLVPVGK